MQGIQDLIRHLGSNPEERDAAALAERFGLEPGVVELALRRAPTPNKPSRGPEPKQTKPTGVENLWRLGTERPGRFLVACSAVALVLYCATMLVRPSLSSPVTAVIAMFGTLFVTFVLFASVVYHLRSVKWALLAAFALPLPLGLSLALFGRDGPALAAAASLVLTLGVVASVLFVPLATFAGYLRVREDERRKQARTRQELIVRLLEIRERLESGASQAAERSPTLLDKVRAHQWIIVPAASLAIRIAGMFLLIAVDPGRNLIRAQTDPDITLEKDFLIASLAAMSVQVTYSVFVFFAGYVARNIKVALGFVLVTEAIGYALLFGPVRYAQPEDVLGSNWVGAAVSYALFCCIAIAGAMASRIREHLRSARLERENDRETLTAEMIELEWQLRPETRQVFVVVVDVVGSSIMKQSADPLVAEYSFREYQELVRQTGEAHGGKVHATAGDGTVLGFGSGEEAIAFAEAVHQSMPGFNETSNRLSTPFQVRIGIHCGEVVGDLGEVQFTRVIDVAAHVEAAAPVGGTALSDEVMVSLPEGSCRPLARNVDGHELFVPVGSHAGATIPAG